MQLMPPSYTYPPQNIIPDSDNIIIQQKPFHYNNIILQLEYIISLDYYHINIYTQHSNQNLSLFGLFSTLQSARDKFNTISL